MRAGGFWNSGDGPTYRGYRDILIGDGQPHWMLQEWHPAEDYGSPAAYYLLNMDPETGLQDLGEYPYQGRYETVLILVSREFTGGQLKIVPIPLSWVVVEMMVPIVIEARKVSMLRRKLALIEQEDRKKAVRVKKIEDAMVGAAPAFGGKDRSAAYLECNSLVRRRAEAIERQWQRVTTAMSGVPKGFQQRSGRIYIN